MGDLILIRDYHLKRLEKKAAEVMGQIAEVVRVCGPGGIDDLKIADVPHYMAPDKDPA